MVSASDGGTDMGKTYNRFSSVLIIPRTGLVSADTQHLSWKLIIDGDEYLCESKKAAELKGMELTKIKVQS